MENSATNIELSRVYEKIKNAVCHVASVTYSFQDFPCELHLVAKNLLLSSASIPFTHKEYTKFALAKPAISPRILLCGPGGSDYYQELLVTSVAKHFNAKLLSVDLRNVLMMEKRLNEVGASAISVLFKVIGEETETNPIVVFLKYADMALASSSAFHKEFKSRYESLPENVVVIASQVGEASKMEYSSLMDFMYFTQEENEFLKSFRLSPKTMSLLSKLFPNKITFELPKDDEEWNRLQDNDYKEEKSKADYLRLNAILQEKNIRCNDLVNLSVRLEKSLTYSDVEKIIRWALIHDYMDSEVCEQEEDMIISGENLQYAVKLFEDMNTAEVAADATSGKGVAHNKHEKNLMKSVVLASDIGVSFNDIGALETVKDTMRELVMLPLQRPEFFSRGQLTKPCKGVLMFGPPGTGKTMMAKAIATEAGANFLNVSLSSVVTKDHGESEKNVKAIFTLASKLSPCIVFIDEVDSLLSKRESSGEHETMRKIKNEFMTSWDGLRTKTNERVIVLAATNRPFDLDEAVIRRLPRRFMVNLPDAENRAKILKVILSHEELGSDVNLHAIANMTHGCSGSDLKNLCIAAAYCPIREFLEKEKETGIVCASSPRAISMEDFRYAYQQVCASVSQTSSCMKKLLEWNAQYGEGGSGKKAHLSYFD